ncbi:MAG: lamin tail domain-containing protein, partial [Candidatus Poribacteria bacterium]|nr:lamin tail domain-containing protein [Candidatus Poribacteria bacterium]
GEWFELFNPTGISIDINGWLIQDNDFDSHLIDNGGPLVIPAGGFLILARKGDSGVNGGITVDYVYSGFFLANGADELILLDGSLTEIDGVEYDGGPAFPDPTGASMFLTDSALDNNVGANWGTSTTRFGDGDFGTPGTSNSTVIPEPSTFLLLGMALVGMCGYGWRRRKRNA